MENQLMAKGGKAIAGNVGGGNSLEKISKCVSDAELERRWKALREGMKKRGLDYLVVQNSGWEMGGAVRYLTDFAPKWGMQFTVIFPAEGDMATITNGIDPKIDIHNFPPADVARGIDLEKRLGHVYFPTIALNNYYDAELAVSVLKEKKNPRIGWVEMAAIPMTFASYLQENLPGATFEDATDLFDDVRGVKSEEEIGYIKECAAMLDAAVMELPKIIKPGMKDKDVYAEIKRFLYLNGCEYGLAMVGSGSPDAPVGFDNTRFQNRTIQKGDLVQVLLENAGPCGYWTETLRPIMVGAEPPKKFAYLYDEAVKAQDFISETLKPGVIVKDAFYEFHKYCEDRGFAVPARAFAHAQGLSYLERPNIRPDDDWEMKENMHLTIHPSVAAEGTVAMTFDNYIIKKGPNERVHKLEKKILIAEC